MPSKRTTYFHAVCDGNVYKFRSFKRSLWGVAEDAAEELRKLGSMFMAPSGVWPKVFELREGWVTADAKPLGRYQIQPIQVFELTPAFDQPPGQAGAELAAQPGHVGAELATQPEGAGAERAAHRGQAGAELATQPDQAGAELAMQPDQGWPVWPGRLKFVSASGTVHRVGIPPTDKDGNWPIEGRDPGTDFEPAELASRRTQKGCSHSETIRTPDGLWCIWCGNDVPQRRLPHGP